MAVIYASDPTYVTGATNINSAYNVHNVAVIYTGDGPRKKWLISIKLIIVA